MNLTNNKLGWPAALLCLVCWALQAQEVDRTSGLSQQVYDKMQVIQELADGEQLGEAETLLRELLDSKLSDYEKAQSWFLMGYIRYQKEDMDGALAAYEQVMATEDIPLGMRLNVMRTLSQLHMVTEDYENALRYVDMLIETSLEPSADNYTLKAQILYQMERMDEAMAAIDTGIELQAALGLPPRENWLLLKNAIYYHRNDYDGMLAIVQQLIDLYPRDRYLLNMAAIYGELGDSKKQLALMEPLYERGSLSNVTHVINLASLYLLYDIPVKAANLLTKEIDAERLDANKRTMDMLAQAWLLSGHPDRALEPLQVSARLAEDGRGYVDLARTQMSLLQWQGAEKSLASALKKGGLRDVGGARLMLGMAQFNQKNFREARRSFAQAGKLPKTEKLARQWLAYLEREEANEALAREVAPWMKEDDQSSAGESNITTSR